MYRVFARKLFGVKIENKIFNREICAFSLLATKSFIRKKQLKNGVKYERLSKTLLIWLSVFYGLHLAGFRVQIAPSILYLMVSSFSAGVMWQALSSKSNAENMQNLLMLPFRKKHFIFSYVSALGTYTLLTKTAGLMAVVLAVSSCSVVEAAGSVLCAVSAVLMTACIYAGSRRKGQVGAFVCADQAGGYRLRVGKSQAFFGRILGHAACRIFCILWVCVVVTGMVLLRDKAFFVTLITGNILLAVLLLCGADAYSFYAPSGGKSQVARGGKRAFVWRYLFRYLAAHPNYLTNTAVMWLAACVMPVFLWQTGGSGMSVMPVGFAILSLNTPLCILLSCDLDLEQAVRFLPGQKKAFCVPYCLFIFLYNMAADVIFLASWHVMNGKFGTGGTAADVNVILTAVIFALQSAVGAVLLEWFYPLRGWKIESDLWHHPRKYIVPAAMLLLAGIVGTIPAIVPVLTALLAVEIVVILWSVTGRS